MDPKSDILRAFEDPAGALTSGTVIDDRFEIVERVGAGGMGFIYRALDREGAAEVALKVLRTPLVSDHSAVKRFAREAWTISQIDHANVVHVISCRRSREGLLYIAMEWLDGLNLAEVIESNGPLSPSFVAWLGMSIARALAEAHSKGIVHRDLKPENVILQHGKDAHQVVKVLDFGIAKLTDPKYAVSKLTQSGTVCGTPEFMSPEQARGDDLDGRSDLYALGCVLFTLVTGRPPFIGSTPLQILFAQIGSALPPLPPSVPPLLADVIRRATAKEPDDRFPDSASMADTLERAFLAACGSTSSGEASVGATYQTQQTILEPLQALGLAPTLTAIPSAPPTPSATRSVEEALVRQTGSMPQVDDDARPTMLFGEQGTGSPLNTPSPSHPVVGYTPQQFGGPYAYPQRPSERSAAKIVLLAVIFAAALISLAVLFALSV